MIRKFAFSALAVASLLTATGAHAEIKQANLSVPWQAALSVPYVSPQRSVDLQIGHFITAALNDGYRRVITDERGAMINNRQSASFKIRLERGVEYRFGARCDEDCNDLDLVLKDASGRVLMADRDEDDTPGFTFRPNWTGEYTLVLDLVDCTAGRSQVGAAVLARY
jgi:hypothetical protein